MLGKYNVGILGAGHIAETMATTLNKMKNAKCYAIASRSMEKAQAFADKFGIKNAYGSYEEMLMDKKVDLVYIATPHSEHYAQAMLCVKHKKPVLCEKAFAANATQAENLLAYAQQEKVFVTEAIWTRYMPMLKTIKEVIASGVIGDVTMLTGNLGYMIDAKERMNDPALAGGSLLDLGVYALNFASMILGDEVERISSACTYTASGVDRQNSFTLVYKDGSMAVLNSTMQAFSDRQGVLYGTKGYAIIENINNFDKMVVYDENGKKLAAYQRPKQITGYEYEVEASIKAIKEGWLQCPDMPHSEILKMMQMMDSLRAQWGIRYPFENENE